MFLCSCAVYKLNLKPKGSSFTGTFFYQVTDLSQACAGMTQTLTRVRGLADGHAAALAERWDEQHRRMLADKKIFKEKVNSVGIVTALKWCSFSTFHTFTDFSCKFLICHLLYE